MKFLVTTLCLMLCSVWSTGQGLENILVETYYISDANDATDSDGGSLVEGSTTYRIFVDMAPGYELQAIYGNDDHTLYIQTSTEFFNNEDRGELTGDAINDIRLDENTVALDSWLTLGAASDEHFAIPKSLDTDGSIVGGANNDGGSEGVSEGLLANDNLLAGIPLTTADGLLPGTLPSGVVAVGLDISMFADVNDGTTFTTSGGAWSVLEGVQGITSDNVVLVAQITTNGDLSFELNIQLGTPDGGTEKYVASNPVDEEIVFPGLTFPLAGVEGCTSPTACNYNPDANQDDGSCAEPVANCSECAGDVLVIIDEDADGVCDADEVLGCTSDTACNFDPSATEDDGSCLQTVPGCTECDPNGTGLLLIDSDGDGICDADEVSGCTSEPTACNYNPDATDEEPCFVPIPECAACNATNDGLVLIDSDGDGICDADEVSGCTSEPSACNYNPDATDDEPCIIPELNCTACNATNDGLDLIDADGDGICDANEITGCSSEQTACNYNPDATDEEPCIIPELNCTTCNATNDGLDLIDSDGDGICDADEQACLGDFDNNGAIASSDLLLFLTEYGCVSGCTLNLDADPAVSSSDLLIFLSLFGTTCPN